MVDTENCFSFENECDFMLSYWSSLGIVLRVTKHSQFPVEKCIFHFDIALCGILSQIELLFGLLVIQLVWYKLRQLFTSVSVKVVDTCI